MVRHPQANQFRIDASGKGTVGHVAFNALPEPFHGMAEGRDVDAEGRAGAKMPNSFKTARRNCAPAPRGIAGPNHRSTQFPRSPPTAAQLTTNNEHPLQPRSGGFQKPWASAHGRVPRRPCEARRAGSCAPTHVTSMVARVSFRMERNRPRR
jgi:hypothetical protein